MATSFDPCSECENPCTKHAQCPPEILKEIDQGNMVGSVEKHRRHLCIGQSVPPSQWPKDIKDLEGNYIEELTRVLKDKKDSIGYSVKLTSASVVTVQTTDDPKHTADWYLFPDQIKLSNVHIEQIEQVIQTLFVDDQSVIKIKDKTKTIEEQLKQDTNLPVFDDNIQCERLNGLWLLVCCHFQRDQRCGAIGPMLVDEIEKYVRETNCSDDVHWLKISHIGGHKFAGNVIVYPSGTWYGRVLPCHIPLLIDAYTSSSEDLKTKLKPLYRGHLDTACNQASNVTNAETHLIRILLNETNYLKKVRPFHTVIVDIRLVFNQIVSMVEKEQIIVTNCFVDQKWTDPRLVWDPLEFENVTWIRMPATSVWYPDTFLYNTADNAGFLLPQDSQNVIVSHNGTVFWPLPLAQLRTRCRMTIKHFPFGDEYKKNFIFLDEQTCDMIFGSWSHTSSLIHYRFWEKTPELPQYTPNNEWKLLAVAQSLKTVEYPNWVEPDTFFEINFTILIVRKPLQAIYNTVVPALMLTTLTLVSFFIPFGQEMQIGISIMLAYSVFSLRLSEDVPSQSDSVHLISLYLTICMFFSLSAMTWFAIANKLREKKRLPYWLRWLAIDYISWIVCAGSMNKKAIRVSKQQQSKNPPTSSVTIPLQPLTTTNSMEYSNHSFVERESLPGKVPFRPSTGTIRLLNETSITPTVWIRRPLSKTQSAASNGPENRRTTSSFRKSRQSNNPSLTKNQESLYAIHIINRLVFFMFLLIVIIINIYTWFIYSRTIKRKLFDNETLWTCFDESRLQIVNCNETL